MMENEPAWIKSGGFMGHFKKWAVMALIAIIGLALPIYRFFVSRVSKK